MCRLYYSQETTKKMVTENMSKGSEIYWNNAVSGKEISCMLLLCLLWQGQIEKQRKP